MPIPPNPRGPQPPRAPDSRGPGERAPRGRRVRCLFGPADGARCMLTEGATEQVVPLPQPPSGEPREAVYRVERRRRGRGRAFEVLVFAGDRTRGA